MDDVIDLRDHRGRLIRLAIAVVIGAVLTVLLMILVRSLAETPNPDPVSSASVGMLAIGIFLAATGASLAIISAIARRLRSS